MADARLAAELGRLAEWDTPALSNALDEMTGRPNRAFSDGSIARLAGPAMCAIAVTAQVRARGPGDDAVPVADLYRAVIAAAADGPVVVAVEDLDDPAGAGAFLGEVVSTFLGALGVVGFVTNGRVRDIAELRASGLAIHAAGLCVARSHVRLVAVGSSVRVGGLDIEPGDVLHADEHGILRLPEPTQSSLAELAAVAGRLREAEQATLAWARSAQFSPEALLARRLPKALPS